MLYFFLPALGPDYFSGFMGFYLSAREGVPDLDNWQICLFGPKGLKDLMKASTFDADYFTNVEVVEFPDNLDQPIQKQASADSMAVDEESKQALSPTFKKADLTYIDELQRVAYRDANATIVPLRAVSEDSSKPDVFSFVVIPAQTRGKFLPQIAAKLGCKPKEHYKTLIDGNSVTLPDGTVVMPEQV